MCYCPTPTLHLNLALTGDGAFILSPQKTHSVSFISALNYGNTENVLINHLLLNTWHTHVFIHICVLINPTHTRTHARTHARTHTYTHTHTHTHLNPIIREYQVHSNTVCILYLLCKVDPCTHSLLTCC